jgi:DNA-binding ferritin-like protein (Dps family)
MTHVGGVILAGTGQLPASYRTALEALERYLNYFGTGGGGSAIYGDLIDLFEQSAANRTPIRQIVGEDPVEFIETFVLNYPKGQWIIRERERLISAIERAAGETPEEKRGQSDSGTASPGDPCARSGEVVQDG